MNTVTVTRGCGCVMEMPAKEGQRPDHLAAKRERWERTNCPVCGQKKSLEHNQNRPLKKGSEVKLLPNGTVMMLVRRDDKWIGHLGVAGNNLEIELTATGLMSLVSKLARKWCVQAGAKVTGKVD